MPSYYSGGFFPSKTDLSASLHHMEKEYQKHIKSPLQKRILLAYIKSFLSSMAKYITLWYRKTCLFVSELIWMYIYGHTLTLKPFWTSFKISSRNKCTQCLNTVKVFNSVFTDGPQFMVGRLTIFQLYDVARVIRIQKKLYFAFWPFLGQVLCGMDTLFDVGQQPCALAPCRSRDHKDKKLIFCSVFIVFDDFAQLRANASALRMFEVD